MVNTTIIMNKEDVNSKEHRYLWYTWLEMFGIDGNADMLCLTAKQVGNAIGITVCPEDINNPLHPNLWNSWLKTLGIDKEESVIWLYLSSLDDNKKVGENAVY
ncbi:MAG: hypothetical protein J7L15_00995 [Clostridiales bacterium]|nr:hypothetical protein [Clostridiales bacterium]